MDKIAKLPDRDSMMRLKLLGRQKRFLKRRRKLQKIILKTKQAVASIIPKSVKYESEDDDCPGDMEESDDDGDQLPIRKFEVSTRRLCSETRQSLAEDQLQNNKKGQLVCLTCLKQFSNIQNLRYKIDN